MSAIEEWQKDHPFLTCGEVEDAFNEVLKAISEAHDDMLQEKSFGHNVVPFVL